MKPSKKKQVCVCGHFGFGENLLNGQTIKTKILAAELERVLGSDQVLKTDTSGGIKALFRLPFTVTRCMRRSKNLVILPAYKGLRMLSLIITIDRLFIKHCTVHYAVVGAWLPSFISNKPLLRFNIHHAVDYIYAETSTMKRQLAEVGFTNVLVMPNCKQLNIIEPDQLQTVHQKPYRLCTFSRVMRMKGLAEAASVIEEINKEAGETIYTLDIYGPVHPADKDWFDEIQSTFPSEINYRGVVEFERSVDVLRDYFMLLFPTRFPTEGIPGTLIDAYAAGLPVLSAKWNSFSDIVDEGITGWGFELDNWIEMKQRLVQLADEPERAERLRLNCLTKAKALEPEAVLKTLIGQLR